MTGYGAIYVWTCPAFVESVFDFTLPALRTEAGCEVERRMAADGIVDMEPVAGGPADDAPSKEVNDDGKVEPALACPDIGDVGAPFLVRPRCVEVVI